MFMAVITDVFPSHPASFEEAEPQARQGLVYEKAQQAVAQKAGELVAKVKTMGGDIKKAAQSMGLTTVEAPPFSRNGAIEGLGSPDAIPEAFTKPVGTLFGPTFIGSFRVVGKITQRIEPNMAELGAQSSALRDDIKRTKARERNALFEDGVREQLIKEGKVKVHADVLKRLTTVTG